MRNSSSPSFRDEAAVESKRSDDPNDIGISWRLPADDSLGALAVEEDIDSSSLFPVGRVPLELVGAS